MLYLQFKKDILYRDYGDFAYITDNRNFGYKWANEEDDHIGDKIISKEGIPFLSALQRDPRPVTEILTKLHTVFPKAEAEALKQDAIEFYTMLEEEGFIVSGMTVAECCEKGQKRREVHTGIVSEEAVKSATDTQDFFEKRFNGEPQLTSIHIEIIGKCNERCVHCYIPHERKTAVMPDDLFFKILDQAQRMNLLHITISGGEPLAHISFLNFIRACNAYNFSVNVLSNLTLLTPEIVSEMKQNPLLGVQTSLYSMDASIHDAITQKRGSFEKTKAGILLLLENDIPVQISCPIMKQNMGTYQDVFDWGKQHNIRVNGDYVIIGQYDHSSQNLSCRMPIADVRKIAYQMAESDPQYLKGLREEYEKKASLSADDYICSVCQSSMCISELGLAYPCPGWQNYVIGNMNNQSLEEIWKGSEKANYLRSLRRHDFPKCLTCEEKRFCTMCMVRNANEDLNSDPLTVNPYFCKIAKINRDIFEGKTY